jgi:hypothetical protein
VVTEIFKQLKKQIDEKPERFKKIILIKKSKINLGLFQIGNKYWLSTTT